MSSTTVNAKAIVRVDTCKVEKAKTYPLHHLRCREWGSTRHFPEILRYRHWSLYPHPRYQSPLNRHLPTCHPLSRQKIQSQRCRPSYWALSIQGRNLGTSHPRRRRHQAQYHRRPKVCCRRLPALAESWVRRWWYRRLKLAVTRPRLASFPIHHLLWCLQFHFPNLCRCQCRRQCPTRIPSLNYPMQVPVRAPGQEQEQEPEQEPAPDRVQEQAQAQAVDLAQADWRREGLWQPEGRSAQSPLAAAEGALEPARSPQVPQSPAPYRQLFPPPRRPYRRRC